MTLFLKCCGLFLWGMLSVTQGVFAASAAEGKGETLEASSRYLLMDTEGRAVTNEDFRGRFQLLAFGYTFCPDVCPVTLLGMTEILRVLGEDAGQLQPVFITVDPERDTPEVLKTYTAFFDTRILALTGSPVLIRRAAQRFRVHYEKIPVPGGLPENYTVDHTASMYLLGPDGEYIRKFAYGRPADEVAGEIKKLMDTRYR